MAASQHGSCASSGRAWQLQAATDTQIERLSRWAPSLCLLYLCLRSIVAGFTAFDPLGMDKPVLTSSPLRYTFGTHSAVALSPSGVVVAGAARHKAFSCHSRHSDKQLFNLHLKCIDVTAWQHS